MSQIRLLQGQVLKFHPGMHIWLIAGAVHAQHQHRIQAASAQPRVDHQRLPQTGRGDEAVAAGDGGEFGEAAGLGEFGVAGGMARSAFAQTFQGAAGADVAERGERGVHEREGGDEGEELRAFARRQRPPAAQAPGHLRRP